MIPTTDPTLLVVTLLQQLALAFGCYLAVATMAGALARLVRLGRLTQALDRITLPFLRRLLDAWLGVSLVAAVGAPAAWGEPPAHPPPTMVRLSPADDPPRPTTTTSRSRAWPTTSTTTTPPPSTTTTAPSPPAPVRAPAPTRAAAPTPPPPQAGPEWTVRRGDHFWSIARHVLSAAWRRTPTDAEIAPYWRQLVEANRDRLADRHNSDLLFAGQVLVVPTPAPP